ncbi:uncharacterized protein LOC123222830 isoform X2 [Mangifera indica]|uniref:uncharacterized protein LOC123206028 isoform X2 n=1 Tax=Mangifera indica TaxID=29780 RepID=UPI001CFB53B6|nr:uncharacterized protein LOC123206028 isoform X2 [Mangifera indica]XP_044501739.1 uncharacterized protein LOC123222830 isoform X2 [Mangifera indica]
MEENVPDRIKSESPDIRRLNQSSKSSVLMDGGGSAENSKEYGVSVSTNVNDNLCGGNLGGVVTVVKTKVVETEVEVKNKGDGEIKLVDDGIGSGDEDGVSLLADISTEIGKINANEIRDFGEREKNMQNPDEVNGSNDEEEENFSDGEYKFCVGDFVWGKIKSHPWWPGQVYDSSYASDYALNLEKRDRLLVAYFDGTFAWCHPYQLKSFVENFEEMSKQSTAKNFINAAQKAVDEIGRRMELKMTCSCVPKESLVGLERPLTTNSGIKQGVLVPECGISKLCTYHFGPSECLTELKHVAQIVSMTNMLELTELKCWLSAFYRAKGGYQLASYHEPQPIPGLEDNDQNGVLDEIHVKNMTRVPIQGPMEEETNIPLLQKSLEAPGNGQCQRRKQKSISEIMEVDVDNGAKNVGDDSVNPVTSSGRRKRKGNDEATGGSNSSSKPKRRNVAKILETTLVTKGEVHSDRGNGVRTKEETKKVILSREKQKSKGSTIENDGGGSKEESNASPVSREKKMIQRDDSKSKDHNEMGFLSRERKKSKYLSPPYTNINRRQSKKDMIAEYLKISTEAQVAQQMTKASRNVIELASPPIISCSDQVVQKKDSKHDGVGCEMSHVSCPETLKLDQNTNIDAKIVKVSTKKVISGIRSIAVDLNSLKNHSVDVVREFLSIFRSSFFHDGSNYQIYNKSQPVRQRKTLEYGPVSSANHQTQTDQKFSERTTRRKKLKKNEEEKLDMVKLNHAATAPEAMTREEEIDGNAKLSKANQAARVENKKGDNKENDGEAVQSKNANEKKSDGKALPASLSLTFGPGSKLPSKDELIKIYSKFGSLNEEETEMFYNNFKAQVVFLRSCDAEKAFKSSEVSRPFGDSSVKFRLQHSPSRSKGQKRKEMSNTKSLSGKGSKTPEKNSALKSIVDEASPFNYIRQKLETIISVLENSAGKMSPELKSKLEGEVNGLLEKVIPVSSSLS